MLPKLLLLFVLLLPYISSAESTDAVYSTPTGTLVIRLPEGWEKLPQEQINAYNRGLAKIYTQQGGIVDVESKQTKVYMLLQIKSRSAKSEKDLKQYRASAVEVEDLSIVGQYLQNGEYHRKSEFYSPKYDTFIMVTENEGRISVMAKRFTSYGYYILHFYIDSEYQDRLKEIDFVLSGISGSSMNSPN